VESFLRPSLAALTFLPPPSGRINEPAARKPHTVKEDGTEC